MSTENKHTKKIHNGWRFCYGELDTIGLGSKRVFANDGTSKVMYCPIIEGKFYSHIADTIDEALLIALAIKHDGLNSQFPKFAARMLNIGGPWAE